MSDTRSFASSRAEMAAAGLGNSNASTSRGPSENRGPSAFRAREQNNGAAAFLATTSMPLTNPQLLRSEANMVVEHEESLQSFEEEEEEEDNRSTPQRNSDGTRSPRRYRTAFSREQLATLEETFARDNYISRPQRCQLAQDLHLAEGTIKVWFQNRRMKKKREEVSRQGLYNLANSDPTLFAQFVFAAANFSHTHPGGFGATPGMLPPMHPGAYGSLPGGFYAPPPAPHGSFGLHPSLLASPLQNLPGYPGFPRDRMSSSSPPEQYYPGPLPRTSMSSSALSPPHYFPGPLPGSSMSSPLQAPSMGHALQYAGSFPRDIYTGFGSSKHTDYLATSVSSSFGAPPPTPPPSSRHFPVTSEKMTGLDLSSHVSARSPFNLAHKVTAQATAPAPAPETAPAVVTSALSSMHTSSSTPRSNSKSDVIFRPYLNKS